MSGGTHGRTAGGASFPFASKVAGYEHDPLRDTTLTPPTGASNSYESGATRE